MNYLTENFDEPIIVETIDFGLDGEVYHEYICYVIDSLYNAFENVTSDNGKVLYRHIHYISEIMSEWLCGMTKEEILELFPSGNEDILEDYDICYAFCFNIIIMVFPILKQGFMLTNSQHLGGGIIRCQILS